ncbi:MAG: PD40 domain-containing protein [Rudaea sp.]|uniref:amidohydrolase family protein n=1 Tax=unclassified Rudaea TaxID=2627037 RepID=UPI0014854812|nr:MULTISPECIES: amidohydrolase family protein [unclassified Rudaea]MBN8886256.1 PD40 domain-containing protein [Rudaea sp.]
MSLNRLLLIGLLCLAAGLATAVENALPLVPARHVRFDTDEGTWISLDVAPDGRSIVFELLGDLYTLPIGGGEATAVTRGLAFDSQPRFAPDGKHIVFVSDRSGNENVWIADRDGAHARQISTFDDNAEFTSPTWSADGRAIFVSIYHPDLTAFELWRFALDGDGKGQRITQGKTYEAQPKEQRYSALGAVAARDGRTLFLAGCYGTFEEDMTLPMWSIERRDLVSGASNTIVTNSGSAMRPALSPDGKTLVYAVRDRGQTGLRVRDLDSGADRKLIRVEQHDDQEGSGTRDLVPGYAFTPDGRAVIAAYAGKIHRVDLASGKAAVIPFRAHVDLDIGPSLRQSFKDDTGLVRARLAQFPALSADGRRVAFSALGRVYTMELAPDAAPRALTPAGVAAFQPAWSPDGKSLVYVSWSADEAGRIWRIDAAGGKPTALTQAAAYYTYPAFTPDGSTVVAQRSSNAERMHTYMEYGPLREADLIALPVHGGEPRVLARGRMGGLPHFGADRADVDVVFEDGLNAVKLDGSGRHKLVSVTGPGFYFQEGRVPVDDLRISPDGKYVLAQIVEQLYLLRMPDKPGEAIDLAVPPVEHRKLTNVGADFFGWADGGKTVFWVVGSTLYRQPLEKIALDRAGEKGQGAKPQAGQHGVESFALKVEVPRDVPHGTLVLRGATAITMHGDQVIDDADVVVVDNRIAAIGKRGAVAVPQHAVVRDVAGKFIVPGFIDTHDHWAEIRRGVLDRQNWSFLTDLAYGKTAGLDPSPLSIDMLAYQDMLDAGLSLGPRVYSTGPAIFSYNEFANLGEVRDVLSRYPDHFRTRNLKEYRTGNRRVRQWVAMAAKELGIQPTTEGALDMKLDLTQIIDGFAGNEHALTAAPLYKDVVELLAQTRTSYTTTLQISHGGPPAQNFYIERDAPQADAKLRHFSPPLLAEKKFARRHWNAPEEYFFAAIAQGAAKVQRAGGLVGIGAHGEVPGYGTHWEMQAHAAGGMTPHEVLRAATMGSAETIGRQDEIGSLEPGKYADLVVLDRDPRADIRNALAITSVMKNGRLYDAATLDEIYPEPRKLAKQWFSREREREESDSPSTP